MNTNDMLGGIRRATRNPAARYAAILSLVTGIALAGCGGEGTEGPEGMEGPEGTGGEIVPPAVAPETAPSPISASDCSTFARGGAVEICHATGVAAAPFTAIKVSSETCTAAHVGHPGDFVATDGAGCGKLEKPACRGSGKSCKLSNTAACCSQTCLCDGNRCRCL